ncbi:MAG: amino acid adenylation domain-containing protein [Planctomycetota bacterium]
MTAHGDDDRAARLRQAIRVKRASARSRTAVAATLPARPSDAPALLGDMQRSLWLLHRLDPTSPAYNLASAFRAHGAVDLSTLTRAFDAIVSRHRLLRSTYAAHDEGVVQLIQPPAPQAVQVIEAPAGAGLAAAVREAQRPFDLAAAPPVRLVLIRESGAAPPILLLSLHHILADERSLATLWEELAAVYRGGVAQPADEPPDAPQYDDFAHWQRQQADAAARQAELDAWRRRLEPLPDDLALPFERSDGGPKGVARGRLLRRTAAPAAHDAVRRLAAAVGTTPFAVCAFAFRLLLHRYTEGRRVAFATPASTRSHPATARMIGYFLNPIVVATSIDEEQPVAEALRGFGTALRGLLGAASVPFDVIAEAVAPTRQRDRHPLFQTMFVYQEAGAPLTLGDATLEPLTLDLGESKFDLTLFAAAGADALELAIEYRTDRFDERWMQGLFDHYETLLVQLAGADRAARVADVDMRAAAERARLEAAAAGPPVVAMPLLPTRIAAQCESQPQATAVACGTTTWSYCDLARAGRVIAARLAAAGIGAGARVGVYLGRSPEMIAAVIGCHWAGAAYVPLDPSYPEARNRGVLEDAEVAGVLTTAALRAALGAGGWTVVTVDDAPPPMAAADEAPPTAPEASATAYLLFTSGSTGRPKGVVVSQENLMLSTAARLQFYEQAPQRFLLLPSLAFDSSVAGLFWTLAAGGALVLPTEAEAKDPERLAALVAAQRVTHLLCVPTLYGHMLRHNAASLAGLAVAIVAGESCPPPLVQEHRQRLPNTRLYNEYGPTEATVWATVHEMIDADAVGPVSIGRPIPGARVHLLDDRDRPVPAGVPGHAWISGGTVAQGYWRRPELTDERFVHVAGGAGARRYRTGDRMVWTPDGRLLFAGREDEQIKLRGFRIEPGEIEAVLLEDATVEQAAVVARAPGVGAATQQLVAFVRVARPGAAAALRAAAAERLPDFMVPSRVVELADLPLLPNGKVDRGKLRALPLESEVAGAVAERAPTAREQALLSLWEGMLGRFGIGLRDNLFELGGHSLLVVEMTRFIERDFGVALTPADVFEHPTVEDLARRIEQRRDPAAPSFAHLFPISPGGDKTPLIFCVPHFFSEMVASRFRGERPVYGLRGISLRQEGNLGRWPTMTALAADLVDEVRTRFPDQESFFIAGYSFGASMAVEAVRIMEARGIPVRALYLIAPMPLDFASVGPLRLQLDGLRQPVAELSQSEALRMFWRGNHPFSGRTYRRVWRRLTVQPWRRVLCTMGKLRRAAGQPLSPRILYADVRVDRFRLHASYRPGVLQTPTVIFNAREPETDAAATWRPHFAGPFNVIETPDPHLDDASIAAAKAMILEHWRDLGD